MKTNTQNYSNTKNSNLYKLVLTGIFAAVVAVCSWISIPLPFTQVPINLAILGVLLAGGLLGSKYGALSLIIYILIGAVGVPVFAGFGAGLGTLAGPTGGYIVGYVLCAAVAGLGASSSAASKISKHPSLRLAAFMALGVAACYTFGTIWYVLLMKTSLWVGLISCVFPFIPLDAIKIAGALFLVKRLHKLIS
jgi:biotin transport system substrate-specific component